nr:hypothetical protein [Providencia rettgeri]
MEIKSLLDEIEKTKRAILQADNMLDLNKRDASITWMVCADNNTSVRAFADQEFLIEAVKSQREVFIARLQKLQEAVAVVEKVIDGLVWLLASCLVNNGGSMTMFEVQLFAYGQHFHFIFIQAEDMEDAEEQVNILNSIDSDVSFQLTGNTK